MGINPVPSPAVRGGFEAGAADGRACRGQTPPHHVAPLSAGRPLSESPPHLLIVPAMMTIIDIQRIGAEGLTCTLILVMASFFSFHYFVLKKSTLLDFSTRQQNSTSSVLILNN